MTILSFSTAAEVTISSLNLAGRTATTLSVTWSAGYPKCYSFTVSHSTQDGSITVTQPADSDTSHTLTSLQPGTTYRIEVEAVRKGDRADGQRAKVIGNFTTEGTGGERVQQPLMHLSCHCIFDNRSMWMQLYVCIRKESKCVSCVTHLFLRYCEHVHIPVVTVPPAPSGTISPTATSTSLTPRPSASLETKGEQFSTYVPVPFVTGHTCIVFIVFQIQDAAMARSASSIVHSSHSGLHMPTNYSDSDGAVNPPVTCVDSVTVHLHSQCSGACSDVQETAEVQS